MSKEFNTINKYGVAISYGDDKVRLVTRQRRYAETAGTDNYVYQLSTYNEINESICTCNTLNELVVLMDNIRSTRGGLKGSGGESIDIGYILIPVVLSVSVSECQDELDEKNISLKRAKALAKLTPEDRLVLGIE